MNWFYIMWIVSAISFVVSLFITFKALNKVVNINTVRINENKKRLSALEATLSGGTIDKS